MSKRQIKKEYKKLKKLYSKSYGNSEDGVEPLKKEYDKLHQSIDENINKIIDGRIKKMPTYDETKDRKFLKKMKVLSDGDKTNTTYSEKYEHLQSASDKELKLIEKILRKQLGYFKRNTYKVKYLTEEYIFVRRRMHYRNVMNKAVGIDLQKFYIKYAPTENSAKKQEIFKDIQIKVEQLSKPISMEKLRELYEYSGSSVETKSTHPSLTVDKEKTKSGSCDRKKASLLSSIFGWPKKIFNDRGSSQASVDTDYSINRPMSKNKHENNRDYPEIYSAVDSSTRKTPGSKRGSTDSGYESIDFIVNASTNYDRVDSTATSSTKGKQQFSLVRNESKEKAKKQTNKRTNEQLKLRNSNKSLTSRDSRESFA